MLFADPYHLETLNGELWVCVRCEECKGSKHRTGMFGHVECITCDGMGELCFDVDEHLADFAEAGHIHAKA